MGSESDSSLRHVVWKRNGTLADRKIAGEYLLVPVRGELAQLQQLFVLNPVAELVWQHLDGRRDLAEIHRLILDSFDVSRDEARQDLLDFIAQLRDAELIEEFPSEPTP